MAKKENPQDPNRETDTNKGTDEGYPLYPENEDIYNQFKEEQDIDPEDPTKTKEDLPEIDINADEENELDIDIMGTELDVPGSELDDDQEDIGNEDEENNYYSIGGDNHHDLEEDDGLLDEDL